MRKVKGLSKGQTERQASLNLVFMYKNEEMDISAERYRGPKKKIPFAASPDSKRFTHSPPSECHCMVASCSASAACQALNVGSSRASLTVRSICASLAWLAAYVRM